MGRGDTLAERTFMARLEAPARFMASPSIVELSSGRLLVAYERWVDPQVAMLCRRPVPIIAAWPELAPADQGWGGAG